MTALTARPRYFAGTRIATHSTWWVTGKMSAWKQALKQQVREAFESRMRASGRPERQMSVTAVSRFGTDNLAWLLAVRQHLPRYGASRGGVVSVRPLWTRRASVGGGLCPLHVVIDSGMQGAAARRDHLDEAFLLRVG